MSSVAVVGLGKMGRPIADRILAAGFELAVFNRTAGPEAELARNGAAVLASPAEALDRADLCVTMLADDPALEAVVLGDTGVLAGARPGTVLVDMSTVSLAVSERVAERAAAAGVAYLRAPVSGNPTVVRGGTLTILVSGDEQDAAAADAVLRAIGPKVLYVGAGESARVVKLALQVLIGGTAELLSEALVLGESAGVDRARLLEAIGSSAIASPFVAYKSEPLLREDYSATFTTAMMLKDVELVLDLAERSKLALPFTLQLRALLEATADGGRGGEDFMALHAHLRESVARPSIANRDEVKTG